MSHKNHFMHIIRRWHGHIGVAATLFLVFLVFTGIVLNHDEALKLGKREISTAWLMRWYGIPPAEPKLGYLLGERYFSWEGEKWALGDKLLAGSAEKPMGAVEAGGVNYIATSSTLYIYQADGQLLDKLEKQSLPAYPILGLGKMDGSVILKTSSATLVSTDGLMWKKIGSASLAWSSPQTLPDDIRHQMMDTLAPGLSLQRILLDAHSGRLFGRYGTWVVDIAAIALLVLGLSGVWIYWRSGKSRRKQH